MKNLTPNQAAILNSLLNEVTGDNQTVYTHRLTGIEGVNGDTTWMLTSTDDWKAECTAILSMIHD